MDWHYVLAREYICVLDKTYVFWIRFFFATTVYFVIVFSIAPILPIFGSSIVSLTLSYFCQTAATAWILLMTIDLMFVHFAALSSVHVAYAHTGCPSLPWWSPSKTLVIPWEFGQGGAFA